MYRCFFKRIGNTDISLWKPKRLSDEIAKPPATSDISLAPSLSFTGTKTRVKDTIKSYLLMENLRIDVDSSDPILGKSFFGAVKLVKQVDFFLKIGIRST